MLSADSTKIAHHFRMRSVQRQCQMGKVHLLHILQNKRTKTKNEKEHQQENVNSPAKNALQFFEINQLVIIVTIYSEFHSQVSAWKTILTMSQIVFIVFLR